MHGTSMVLPWVLLIRACPSLAWPDRYFFYRAFIACSISARRKKRGSGLVPLLKSFLTPPSRPEVLISLILKLYATASYPRKGVDLSTHFIYLYKLKRAKEINTSGRLGGVKKDWVNGTRPDPLFFYRRLYC